MQYLILSVFHILTILLGVVVYCGFLLHISLIAANVEYLFVHIGHFDVPFCELPLHIFAY